MSGLTNRRGKRFQYDSSLQLANTIGAGVNKIKKQIRNVERLLARKKDTLPATVIIEKERTLEALKLELNTAELRTVAKKNAKKYHMVRFFERKKATRRYKQALQNVKQEPGNSQRVDELHQRELELCYVVNFPKTTKYIALYPTVEESSNSESTDETAEKRKAFLEVVAEQFENGTLPVPLEDILKGKKLNKESAGIALAESEEEEEEEEEEEDYNQKTAGTESKNLSTVRHNGDKDDNDSDDFFE
ncbi:Efg1p Ecym_4765 [Eremothecium cymbalariae DBVPG|uniref:rRNA-processing protein EFG1 n=1 Tax=Eremothecium cymbalariae (strain CBS 270.75 / DBVPG 7215 / KCTC 17166 / NRRL Y-17582) TaxID=931890 RepID=G8JSQ5_ERECY|nr:hypothetical protein Ecym_4765 [Eremothecium cymbalariae DBVPG\